MAINKLKYNDPNTPFQVSDLNITTPSSSSSSRVNASSINASSINASSINSSLLTVGVGGTIITTTGIGSVGIGSTEPGAILDLNVPRSGYGGNLLDLKNNGTSLVRVDSTGRLMVGGAPFNNHLSYTSNLTPDGLLITGAAYALQVPSTFANDGFVIRESSNGNVRFEVSANTGNCHIFGEIGLGAVRDTILVRDAVGVFAQRNSTNAQTFRIYNTYTSATNFERGQVGWTTNTFIIGTEKGSAGGNPRQLDFQTNGITRVAITTTGNVGVGTTTPTSKFTVVGDTFITGITTITGNLNTAGNYYVKVARITNQTIPNASDTLIGFSTITDTNGWFNATTNRITPTVSGNYRVDVMLNWQAGSITNDQTNIQVRKNGTTFAISQIGIQTFAYTQNVGGIVAMNGTTDYIDFTVYTANPTSQDVTGTADGAWTKMEIFKLN